MSYADTMPTRQIINDTSANQWDTYHFPGSAQTVPESDEVRRHGINDLDKQFAAPAIAESQRDVDKAFADFHNHGVNPEAVRNQEGILHLETDGMEDGDRLHYLDEVPEVTHGQGIVAEQASTHEQQLRTTIEHMSSMATWKLIIDTGEYFVPNVRMAELEVSKASYVSSAKNS